MILHRVSVLRYSRGKRFVAQPDIRLPRPLRQVEIWKNTRLRFQALAENCVFSTL
jgi:hypothetical protein